MSQTIILTKSLAKQFAKKHQINLPNAKLSDAFDIIDVNYPGFFATVSKADYEGTGVTIHSKYQGYLEREDWCYPLDPGDTITISPTVGNSGGKNGFLVQALGLAAIGGIIAITGGAATPFFIAAGATLAKGVLSQMLTPTTKKTKEKKRSTFFSGSIPLARDRRIPSLYGAPVNSQGKIVGRRIEGMYASSITRNYPITEDDE